MRWRWAFATVVAIAIAIAVTARLPLPARLLEPGSIEVRYADGSVAHVRLAPDGRARIPVRLAEVDPAYVRALTALEDQRFWSHPGVDPFAVARAVVQDVAAWRVVSGASTITMQLARLLEPRPRTLRSKAIEAGRALQIEGRMSKTEILEAYLAFAPYGGNVEGVEAAALLYFGHRADRMSADEIAVLLAVPQDPTSRFPRKDHTDALRVARDRVLARLAALPDRAGFDEAALIDAAARPVPSSLRTVPREAPHAAAWLAGRARSGAAIATTLDRGIQTTAERAIRRAHGEWARQGIHNAAVAIVDHRSDEVKALIGNPDFFDAEHGGQIVGFDVARSPGSTMKPFVYALALDRGQALPETLSLDVPVSYSGYSPENYDGRYDGLVPLEQALARSLNVPFVLQLEAMGMAPFEALLRNSGVRSQDLSPGALGLSAVVGGMEVTPLELAALYAALANDGQVRDLRVVAAPTTAPRQLFSAGAAWLTRRALAIRDRPDFPTRKELGAAPRGIHWKTGTSFGNRDAWAVGSNDRYTVVVWTGNFDRSASPHLVGAETPAPVLFDLLEALDERRSAARDLPPGDLTEVRVCSLSGHVAGEACAATKVALAPVASVPTDRCPFHQTIEIDAATGLRVGPSCRATRDVRSETALVWPVRVRRWLRADLTTTATPDWAPGCEPSAQGAGPRIRSPESGAVALLVPGMARGRAGDRARSRRERCRARVVRRRPPACEGPGRRTVVVAAEPGRPRHRGAGRSWPLEPRAGRGPHGRVSGRCARSAPRVIVGMPNGTGAPRVPWLAWAGAIYAAGIALRIAWASSVRPWTYAPDHQAWGLFLREALTGPLRADQLFHFPHEGWSVIEGSLAFLVARLSAIDPSEALAWAALAVDSVGRAVETAIVALLFGSRVAFGFTIWSAAGSLLLISNATAAYGGHLALSPWPLVRACHRAPPTDDAGRFRRGGCGTRARSRARQPESDPGGGCLRPARREASPPGDAGGRGGRRARDLPVPPGAGRPRIPSRAVPLVEHSRRHLRRQWDRRSVRHAPDHRLPAPARELRARRRCLRRREHGTLDRRRDRPPAERRGRAVRRDPRRPLRARVRAPLRARGSPSTVPRHRSPALRVARADAGRDRHRRMGPRVRWGLGDGLAAALLDRWGDRYGTDAVVLGRELGRGGVHDGDEDR